MGALLMFEERGWQERRLFSGGGLRLAKVDIDEFRRFIQKKMRSLHRFLIVIEKAGKIFFAYSPDLPGCVATGKDPRGDKKSGCQRQLRCTSADSPGTGCQPPGPLLRQPLAV